jgi:hypothetical protein
MGFGMDQAEKKTSMHQAFLDFRTLVANGIGWVDQSYWMIDQAQKRTSNSQVFLDFCTLAANKIE